MPASKLGILDNDSVWKPFLAHPTAQNQLNAATFRKDRDQSDLGELRCQRW
jgi:hypothetical protein